MNGILQSLASGGWSILLGWILPSAIGSLVFSFFVFPEINHLPVFRDLIALDSAQEVLLITFVALVLGLVLNANRTSLYLVLESYLWPRFVFNRGAERQRRRLKELRDHLESTQAGTWDWQRANERLQQFPAMDRQIVASRLGNVIRAYETYGVTRFGLDAQILWVELYGLAPESIRTEYDRGRAGLDYFVCSIWIAFLLGLTSLVGYLGVKEQPLVVVAAISLLSIPVLYQRSVSAARHLGGSIQAIVNVGRRELASSMSLRLPETFDSEREMWRVVNRLAYYGVDPSAAAPPSPAFSLEELKQLDRYRV